MAVTTAWGRKCTLTVANGKVSGTSNLSNFPVLITQGDLPDEVLDSDISTAPKSDGGDIRFTSDSAGSNELAFEIVHFTQSSNPLLATVEIWVKTTLQWGTDTVIYMWWDNSAANAYANTATYGRNAVWSDYELVSHDSGTVSGDSTGNYTLTESGTVTPTTNHLGISGKAQAYSSGVAEYFSTSISSTIDLGSQEITMQLWGNKNAVSGMWGRALQIHTNSPNETFMLIANPAGGTAWAAASGVATTVDGYRKTASDSAWHMVHAISTASGGPIVNSGSVYVDGSNSNNLSETGIGTGDAYDEIYIGARNDNSTAADFEGSLAEVRIRFSALSSDWIATEYNNQVDDGTFWTAGTPENTAVPSWRQEGYRFRKDDGSESAASWLAAQDTAANALRSSNFRLRTLVEEYNEADGSSDLVKLQFKGVSRGPDNWIDVPTLSNGIVENIATLGSFAYENTSSFSYTVSAGANRIMIVFIGLEYTALETPTSVQYGGQNLTRIGGDDSGTATFAQIHAYYLNEAGIAAASNTTLSINGLSSVPMSAVRCYENINQSNPVGSSSSNNSDTATNPITGASIVTPYRHATIAACVQGNTETTGVSWGHGTGVALTELVDVDDHVDASGGPSASLAAADRINITGSNETHDAQCTWTTTPNRSAVFQVLLEPAETPLYISASTNITNGANTTAQLTAPASKTTADFDGGKIWDTSNGTTGVTVLANEYREDEWCLKANTATAEENDQFDFRVTIAGSAPDATSVTPRVTLVDVVQKSASDTLRPKITDTSNVPTVFITDVTPNPFDDKETGIVITGTSFEATQGTGKLEFTPGADYGTETKTAQTVTAWGDTSITFTGVLPTAGPNAGYLWVTNDTGDRSLGYPVILRREAAFGLADSPYVSNQSTVIARLTAPAGSPTFNGGYFFDTANHYSTIVNEGDPGYCEYEWCIKALDAATDDDQYEFRVVQEYEHTAGGSIPLDTYTLYPKFTIQSVILKAGTDALYPRVVESRGIGSTSSRTDEIAMLLNDQRSFATSQFTRNDSLIVFLNEVYQILVTLSRDDDLKPVVDETIAILVSVARGDDIKPKIDESSAIFKFIQIVANDTLRPKITESMALLLSTILSVFDYLQIDMPDFDYTYSQVESLREDSNVNTLFKFPYQMDDYGVVIGDFDTLAASSFGLGWSYATAEEAINQVFPTDTLAVEVVESAAELLNMFERSDEVNPRITESLINLLRSSRVDELSLAVAETTLNLLRLSRTDELFPQILETVTLIVTLTRSDELLPRLDEITSILITLNRSDDLAPLFIETFSSAGTMNRPDGLAPLVDDQSTNALTSSRTDALYPKIDSTIDLLSYLSRQDSLAPRLVEGLTNLVSYLNRSDELAPKIDEIFSSFGTIARSDNLILSLEDTVNIASVLLLSDDLNVTIDDVLDILSFIVSRYRWRDDDGNETAASWLASENTDVEVDLNTNIRLRIQIDSGGDTGVTLMALQYRKVGDPDWEWRDVE